MKELRSSSNCDKKTKLALQVWCCYHNPESFFNYFILYTEGASYRQDKIRVYQFHKASNKIICKITSLFKVTPPFYALKNGGILVLNICVQSYPSIWCVQKWPGNFEHRCSKLPRNGYNHRGNIEHPLAYTGLNIYLEWNNFSKLKHISNAIIP